MRVDAQEDAPAQTALQPPDKLIVNAFGPLK
jgi:hypothetical protein